MKRLCTILVLCTLAAGLSACGDAGVLVAPEAPRYDGGFGLGSGGRASADTTTVAPSSTETTTEETTSERGTYGMGSGG